MLCKRDLSCKKADKTLSQNLVRALAPFNFDEAFAEDELRIQFSYH
jgi:hypothetical protein